MSDATFKSVGLNPELIANLSTLGYHTMTTIQAMSLPAILSGKDVIGQGKTGSGKTAAFGLGLLQKLNVKLFKTQSLVLCPTRELADQVASELRRLARATHNVKILTLCGGVPIGPQIGSLERGAHIVVGTPGRIDDHLRKKTLRLGSVSTLVLDEADRMLDMGFQDTIDDIIDCIPTNRQTLLFSATFPREIESIAERVMLDPVIVQAPSTHDEETIKQTFHQVSDPQSRMIALRLLLAKHRADSALVFCNTKRDTQDVSDELNDWGFYALAIHGDLDQRERDQALIQFSNKSIPILVATDVAARGLDINALDLVINYHIAHDPETHVHRIGRTGRAGSSGIACTLYSNREMHKVDALDLGLDPQKFSDPLPSESLLDKPVKKPLMATIKIDGGKKQKIRPGDIVGALTGDGGIAGDSVGKINVSANWSYVAVQLNLVKPALKKLSNGKLKGRSFRVKLIS